MSGNTTQLGVGLGQVGEAVLILPLDLVAAFLAGAFTGNLLSLLAGRWCLHCILVLRPWGLRMQLCGTSMALVRIRPMSLARFSVQARILQRRCGRLSMARTLQLLTSGLVGWRMAGPDGFWQVGDGVVESRGGSGLFWYADESSRTSCSRWSGASAVLRTTPSLSSLSARVRQPPAGHRPRC